MSCRDLSIKFVLSVAIAASQSDDVLGQDIQGLLDCDPFFDQTFLNGLFCSRQFDQFKGMCGDKNKATTRCGTMSAATRTLDQTPHSFWATHLEHLVDFWKVDTQIQT